MVKNLIKRLIVKYKTKLIIVAMLISIIMGLFIALINSQVYIEKNIQVLHDKYNSFDFKFDRANANLEQIEKFSKKYAFKYKIAKNKKQQIQLKLKQNNSQVLVNVDESKTNLNTININYLTKRENSFATPYLQEGKFVTNANEINVTKDFVVKTGYQINDSVNFGSKKYKIVGIFADQNNQSISEVDNALSNGGSFDVIVSNNTFNQINVTPSEVVMSRFKTNLNYEQRKKVYQQMQNDKEFVIKKDINKVESHTQTLAIDDKNYCDYTEFKDYLNNNNLSESNFKYFSDKAQKSLKSDNKCQLDVSNDLIQKSSQQAKGGIVEQKPVHIPLSTIYEVSPQTLSALDNLDLSEFGIDNVSKGIIIDATLKHLVNKNVSSDDLKNFYSDLIYNHLVTVSRNLDEYNVSLEEDYKTLSENNINKFSEVFKNLAKTFSNNYKPVAKNYKVTYQKIVGKTEQKQIMFNSFNDIEELNGSKQMFVQLNKQKTLIIYLGIIFAILLILVTSIVLSQIIKSINIEIGTLKAIGASNKFISNKFMAFVKTLMGLVIVFSIITVTIFQILIVNFYNDKFAIVEPSYFSFDLITNPIIIILILSFIYIFGKKSLERVIKDDTLLLLKNLNTLKSVFKSVNETKHPRFGKFWNEIVVKNTQKTTIVFFIGIVMSIFAATLVILFSNVSTYLEGGNGFQFNSDTKLVLQKQPTSTNLNNTNSLNLKNLEITSVEFNNKISNSDKQISKSNPLNLSVVGINKKTIRLSNNSTSYLVDIRSLNDKTLANGIILAKKYHDLYKLNVGDKLQVTNPGNAQTIAYNISGFLNENENIFAYTSNSYLQSLNDDKREVNAYVDTLDESSSISNEVLKEFTQNKVNIGNLKSIKINKNQEIMAIIVQCLVILTLILLPIIIIIVSDVVDSNTKTIATMRAIGISKFKIRMAIIQPFSIIYMLGALIGAIIVVTGFASQFSAIFYAFLNVDVTYINDFYILIGVLVIIWLIYEIVISLAFTRISVISLSKTLNDDSARTQITKDDLSRFYKSSAKSLLDFNKKPFYYKPTKVAKLKKPVSRSFWVEVIKYYWPILASNLIQVFAGISTIVTAFILSFIPSKTLALTPEVQLCLGFVTGGWILGTWKDRIISVAITYATQYYRQNKKAQFKRAIAFAVQISLVSQGIIILGIILFGQLGLQTTDIPMSAYQYLGVGIFAAFIQQIIEAFSLPYKSAITASGDNKIEIAANVIQIFTSVIGSALSLVFAFTKDIDIYLFTFVVVIITSVGKFVPIIYGTIVKRHKSWAGGSWKYVFSFRHPVNSRILTKSIPYIISSILEQTAEWIKAAIFTILGLAALVANPGEIVDMLTNLNWITKLNLPEMLTKLFNAPLLDQNLSGNLVGKATILAVILSIYKTLSIFKVFDYMDYFMKRILARRNYYFAVQVFNNIVKNIFTFLIVQSVIIILVAMAIFELLQGSGPNAIIWQDVNFVIMFFIYGTIMQITSALKLFFQQTLEAGGEFKFTQFINIVFTYFNIFVILSSIALHLDLITILTSAFVVNLIQIWIYYARIKTGRWLSCVTDDVTIHSNLRGWKDKKLILQKLKDKRYLKQLRK